MNSKKVWITGASSGIGKALALAYAQKGYEVILSSRNISKLEDVKKGCDVYSKSYVEPLDLTDASTFKPIVERIWEDHGKIDILINNGGVSQRSSLVDTDPSVLREIMEINFFGSALLTKTCLPYFIKQGEGKLGVITSVTGLFGFPLRTAYASSKHALHGFFESLALELRPHGISVHIVAPGRIKTDISLNARLGDGKKHGEMDPGQKNGIPVEICAQKIVQKIDQNKPLIIIAKGEKILVFAKKISLKIFYYLASKVSAT